MSPKWSPGLPKWSQKSCKIGENLSEFKYHKISLEFPLIFKDFRNCETSKNIEKPMVFIGFCYCQHFEKTLTIHQKIRPKINEISKKNTFKKPLKPMFSRRPCNLAKIVPWSIPRLQNGSPDGSQESPDGSQNL